MKRNLIVIGILILGLSAVYLLSNDDSSTLKSENSNFATEDTASITKIFMADKADNTILLERQESGRWMMNGKYLARQDAIDNLIYTLKELKVRTPVPKSAFDNIVKNIAGKSVKVEVFQNKSSSPSKTFYVGSSNQDHSGTYMLMENSSVPYVMHLEGHYGYLGPRFFTNENEWRSTVIYNYQLDDIKSIELEYPGQEEKNLKIVQNEDGNFGLLNEETQGFYQNIDSAQFFRYISLFQRINFESFEETKSEAYIDSIKLIRPIVIFRITNQLGVQKEVKTYIKPVPAGYEDYDGNKIKYDLDRLYALIDDRDFVVIQYYVFDPLIKTKQDLLQE